MARMDICESNRRIGGWLSNEFENDYIVTRDDGSRYRCFEDYNEAQKYLDYLQDLDNQDKLINEQNAIRVSSDALRAEQARTNQLLEERQRSTQDWEQRLRREQALHNLKEFHKRKQKKAEEAKKRQAAKYQQQVEEAKRQDREKFLLAQARLLSPKFDSGEISFDYHLHHEVVKYALCHNLYHFKDREPLWALVEECYKYKDPFLNEIDIHDIDSFFKFSSSSHTVCESFLEQYELTDTDVHRLFKYALSFAQKNTSQNALNYFLASCTKNLDVFCTLFIWNESFECYDKDEWSDAIICFLKYAGTKGLQALNNISTDPIRKDIVSAAAQKSLLTLKDDCFINFADLINLCNGIDDNEFVKVVDCFVDCTSGKELHEIESVVRDIYPSQWTRLSEGLLKRLNKMTSADVALFIFLWKHYPTSIKKNVVSKYLTACIRKLGLHATLCVASAIEGDKDKCDIVNAVRLATRNMDDKESLEARIQDLLDKLHKESEAIDRDEALLGEFRLKSRNLFEVFNYPVSAYDSLEGIDQKLEPQRSAVEKIVRKDPNFSSLRLDITNMIDTVHEIQEDTKIWYSTHVLPSSEIESRLNALRLPAPFDMAAYLHKVKEAIWSYIAAVISSRLNLESLSRGHWFSKRRREISSVQNEMNALYRRYAPKFLYKKSADLSVFAEFMSSLDSSIRFSKHQAGYQFRQSLMKASGK